MSIASHSPDATPRASAEPRVALITGGNTGIGRVTAIELARAGLRVFIAGRSLERTRPVIDQIDALGPRVPAEFLPLDLADLDSVRACAAAFLARDLPLHLLINNAGLAGTRGITRQGFEVTFGVNHLGHFLLTRLLLERLEGSAPARIVTVASRAHSRAPGIDWDAQRRSTASLTGLPEYSVSKLANVLFSAELDRRVRDRGITACSLHPGVVATDIWRRLPAPVRAIARLWMVSVEEGARTTLHCALAPGVEGRGGLYWRDGEPVTPSAPARDPALAAELWRRSEAWIG